MRQPDPGGEWLGGNGCSLHGAIISSGRIRRLGGFEALMAIQKPWQRLGSRLDSLTPSFATALEHSGDRPAALAEPIGILLDDGIRLPTPEPTNHRLGIPPRLGIRLPGAAYVGQKRLRKVTP